MSAPELARTIREVKSRVSVPVTYADVWEFWMRHRDLAGAVDYITIHVLPYWEDFPIPARDAAPHVDAIRKRVLAAFPGKDVFVGEFGWPSAGRMREGALPSPVTQARALHEVLARARREGYQINLIEAYDQPWKRKLEGTVGGHWGIYDAYRREPKFAWGGAVSDHPHWRSQAAGGVALAAAVFGAALVAGRRSKAAGDRGVWLRIAAIALVSGSLIGWTLRAVPLESLTIGDWIRSLAWAAVALIAPVAGAAAVASGARTPSFARILGRRAARPRSGLALLLGAAADRARGAVGAGGARPGFRSALPGFSVRAADRRGVPVSVADTVAAAAAGSGGGSSDGRHAVWRRALHRLQRRLCQLAGLVAGRRPDRALAHSGAGAGRARLSINSAAARPAGSALCSTSPNAAATSAIVTRTIEGRTRLSRAAISATEPKT